MEHTLINTIIASIVVAFIFGLIASKLRLPVIFGYLLAGIAIGPHTPGYVANMEMARQLAEIGIILLMFGVGLHFSFRDLAQVRTIALPGALFQMLIATLVGGVTANFLGHGWTEGFIFGFALSVASTIVLLRALEQRHALDEQAGKIAIGWLIIEDIAMVLALVLIPVISNMTSGGQELNLMSIAHTAAMVIIKIGGFIVFMMLVGRRFLPSFLLLLARARSSEMTTLGTLAIALGFAFLAYEVFGASLALGAFLAGMVLGESEIGRKSAAKSLPMRDAFSVLFFVSVGMLFEPATLLEQPLAVSLTFLIIIGAKSLAALLITRLFGQPHKVSYTIAIGLAQIGEFSFIMGSVSLSLGLITQDLYNLILAGAMLSIVTNPFLFRLYDFAVRKERAA